MSDTDCKAERRAAVIQGMRDLAAYLEANPQVEEPYMPAFNAFPGDLAALRAATHLTGKWDKRYVGQWVAYVKRFGPVSLELNIARDQVCRQVQTGTKRVEAVEAHDEPVFEWICTDEPADAGQVEAAELMSAGGSA